MTTCLGCEVRIIVITVMKALTSDELVTVVWGGGWGGVMTIPLTNDELIIKLCVCMGVGWGRCNDDILD